MHVNSRLADLTCRRAASWRGEDHAQQGRQALFAFTGAVYVGLEHSTLGTADLEWAHEHRLMARHMEFSAEGYRFCPQQPSQAAPHFVRG